MNLVFKNSAIATLLLTTTLSGCDHLGKQFTCSSEDSMATTLQIIKENMEKAVGDHSKADDGTALVSRSNISAALDQIKMSIENIRTTKKDPDSTMQFCSGTLKLVYPLSMIQDAEKTREIASLNNVDDLAEKADIVRKADAFESDIEYSIQPTDDRSNTYAEVSNFDDKINAYSEIVVSYLLKASWERMKRSELQDASESQNSYDSDWQNSAMNYGNAM